eukprot:COSAG01_NODE_14946_length_1392_cov_351.592220_2_plen_103_part_00
MNSSTDSDVHAESEAPWALLDDAAVDVDGWLRGRFLSFLPVAAVNRRPYELHLELRRRDDCESQRHCGALIALSPSGVGGDPEQAHKVGNALSYWASARPFF